ncbi:hypothetical protein [Streptomyces sp.]|uniref:hypothetical protein n=1 Tax=Streptomyces sp. TaxID=1931 RepID=UPI002F92DA34
MSDITPAQIAGTLSGGYDIDEELNGWVDVCATKGSNVALIKFTPCKDTPTGGEADPENVQLFTVAVVGGRTEAIVFDRAAFEQRVNERFDEAVRKLGGESLAFMPATIAALRAQILALDVDLAEAAQAQKGGAQ